VKNPLRGDKYPLLRSRIGFRLSQFGKAIKMVGVTVRDENEIDNQWIVIACFRKSRIGMPSKELVVAAVDEDHFTARRFDDQAIALLDVDHRQTEQCIRPKSSPPIDKSSVYNSPESDDLNLFFALWLRQDIAAITPVVLGFRTVGSPKIYDVVIKILHRNSSTENDQQQKFRLVFYRVN